MKIDKKIYPDTRMDIEVVIRFRTKAKEIPSIKDISASIDLLGVLSEASVEPIKIEGKYWYEAEEK